MKYLMLIYNDFSWFATASEAEQAEHNGQYLSLTQAEQTSGRMAAGDMLVPQQGQVTVRVRDGQTVATDGPFAETKEVLSGYYVFEAATRDEAIELASRIPGAQIGAIEVIAVADPASYSG